MSERAEALARQFEQVNEDLIDTVQSMSDEQWKKVCSGEQWPAGVTANHVGGGHQPISSFVQAAATGGPAPTLTPQQLDASNAQYAQQAANCTKEETIVLLRQGGQAAAALVRGLSDEQLSGSLSMFGNAMSTEAIITNILIGHVQGHTASIKQAIA